jgi:signal transduction histidine kinase
MNQFLLKSEIRTENDIVWARKKTRELSQFLKLDKQEQTRLATAVSEIARNAFQYAGRGTIEFNLSLINERVFIVIQVKDNGPGIKYLKEVLEGTYVSREGMGVGLIGSKKLVDDLIIDSDSQGTMITLKKVIPLRRTILTQAELKALLDTFISQNQNDPLDEIQKQNQEILLTVGALNEKKDELSRLNQELEDTNRGVVALYAELDEKAESLRKANESKTSFLSDMTHEFRSPLNSILSIAEILLEEAKLENKPDREKQVSFIMKAARSLSDLVNDLLDIAKIEAGKIPVRVEKFTSYELMSTLRGLMRPIALSNPSVNLIFENIEQEIWLQTDEGKVAQILRNLLSNAIKYTEEGEIIVASKRQGDEVHFSVKDTGIGIDDDHLDIIFSEFTQIDHSLQSKVKGTGLGLPLSKKLATLLGGDLRVVSNKGEGSEFILCLPLNYYGPSDAVYDQKKNSKTFVKSDIKKILIVDDDEMHRMAVKKIMHKRDLETQEAPDGKRGILQAKTWLPDLIILDLVMPEMDGIQFLRAMMVEEKIKDIPIILNTSKQLASEELLYLEQVTNLVIQKDTQGLLKLEQIIDDLLKNQRASL